jgi:hypothetical protein
LTVAGHATHRENLARVHSQVDGSDRLHAAVAVGAEPPHGERLSLVVDHRPLRPFVGGKDHLSAHHQPGELAAVGVGRVQRGHRGAVPQDRDSVRRAHHLVQLVGDEDDRPSIGDHRPQGREQGLGFLWGQHRGRLVED